MVVKPARYAPLCPSPLGSVRFSLVCREAWSAVLDPTPEETP